MSLDYPGDAPLPDLSGGGGYDLSSLWSLLGGLGGLGLTAWGGLQGMNRLGAIPTTWGTGMGSTMGPGSVSIAPFIGQQYGNLYNRVGGLANSVPGLYAPSIANLESLYNEAGGNRGAFVQAMVDPLQASVNQAQGQLTAGQQARGLRGSSIANQEQTQFLSDTGQQLADARAKATQMGIQTQQGLAQSILGAQTGMLGMESGLLGQQVGITNQQLMQELQSLGLGTDWMKALMGRAGAMNQQQGDFMSSLGGMIGELAPLAMAFL
jgi:hypothetical protein